MSSKITPPDVGEDFGPAMAALTVKQRAFVRVFIEYPLLKPSAAVRRAGYSSHLGADRVMAHVLLHNEKVLKAINEELDKRFRVDAVIGRKVLIEIALDKEHPQRLKAAEALLNRGGFHTMSEQRIRVEHTDLSSEAMIERIRELALRLDVDPVQLLGANAPDQKLKH